MPSAPQSVPANTPVQTATPSPAQVTLSLPVRWPPAPNLIAFVVGVLLYIIGYMAPWGLISFLGISISFNGGLGLEALILLVALTALGLRLMHQAHSATGPLALGALMSSATCLAFAGGELVYMAQYSSSIQIGIGLPLLTLGALVMVGAEVARLPFNQRLAASVIPIAWVAAAAALGGYRAHQTKQVNPLDPWGLSIPTAQASDHSTDVEVQINSTRTLSALTSNGGFFAQRTPKPGKTFVVCNVTATYKGTAGSVILTGASFKLTASNRQLYNAVPLFSTYRGINPVDATLLPNGSTKGDLVFEIDTNAQPETISYSSSPF